MLVQLNVDAVVAGYAGLFALMMHLNLTEGAVVMTAACVAEPTEESAGTLPYTFGVAADANVPELLAVLAVALVLVLVFAFAFEPACEWLAVHAESLLAVVAFALACVVGQHSVKTVVVDTELVAQWPAKVAG